jgi:putative membrane protein
MKLAPLSVPYRVVQRGASLAFALVFALATGSGSGLLPPGFGALAVGAVVGAAILLLVGYEVAYYRRYDYGLTADTLDIRSGVLSLREREIPVGRIQNVDIRRNVVQRALGIAAVSFETAGGGGTEATLRFVEFAEAKRLQREVARLKRGGGTGDDAEPEVEELYAITDRELALLAAFSFDLRLPGAGLLLASGSVPFLASLVPSLPRPLAVGAGAALAVVVLLVSWLAGAAVAVANFHGFRLTRAGGELQYERGLLRRYDGSIPLDKVQTLTVEDDPLRRRFGYAALSIETAGYAPGQGDASQAVTAVPLAARERIRALAAEIEPFGDPEFERPPRRARQRYLVRYLLALGGLAAALYAVDRFAPVPGDVAVPWYATVALVPVVAVAAHLKWRHRGWWLGPDHVVTRNGWLRRRTRVVPYYRVQTVIDGRTIFQRRRRLATVTVDTAGSLSLSGGDAAAVDVDYATADRLRDELDERLRVALAERRGRRARSRAGPAATEGEGDAGDAGAADGDRDGDGAGAADGAHGPSGAPDVPRGPDGRDDGGFVFGGARDAGDGSADGEGDDPDGGTGRDARGDGADARNDP